MWHTNMDNIFYIWHIKPIPNATVTNKSCSFDAPTTRPLTIWFCSSLGNCAWNIANVLLIATGHDANSSNCNAPIVLLVMK